MAKEFKKYRLGDIQKVGFDFDYDGMFNNVIQIKPYNKIDKFEKLYISLINTEYIQIANLISKIIDILKIGETKDNDELYSLFLDMRNLARIELYN